MKIDQLPSPARDDIFGHLSTLKSTNVHKQLQQWSEDFGGLYRIRIAYKKAVVVGKRNLIQEILKQRPDRYKRRKNIELVFQELGMNGIFSAEGADWKQQRQLFNPAFNGANLRYFFPAINKITDQLIAKAHSLAESGKPIDIKKLFTEFTVDTISNLAFGYDINTLGGDNKKLHKHLSAIFPGLYSRLTLPLPLWRIYKTDKDRKLENANTAIKSFLNERIAITRQKMVNTPSLKEKPENLLQAMIAEQEKNQSSLSDNVILSNAITILIAGEDTTANSLA